MVAAWNERNRLLYVMYLHTLPTCRHCAARTREHLILIGTTLILQPKRIAQEKITKARFAS